MLMIFFFTNKIANPLKLHFQCYHSNLKVYILTLLMYDHNVILFVTSHLIG